MPFGRLGLAEALVEGVREMGYEEPTPIQEKAIPPALEGRDVIGCAQTGTGKTAAFVLPVLARISDKSGIKALVVTPTRELADQILDVSKACSKFTNHKVAAVYGGVPYEKQQKELKEGVDLLVATPGRLLDLMRRHWIDTSSIEIFILDEADRMLDMGFWPDVEKIVDRLPHERQSLLFSATMSPKVLEVIGHTLNDPVQIEVGPVAMPVESVEQSVYPVDAMQKPDLLLEMLKSLDMPRVLVFTKTKRRADMVYQVLESHGVSAAPIHSDLSQSQRQRTLNGFKTGKYQVLVATDIVARGIDVEGVTHVVNYDVPDNPEDYVHRIGRTARAKAEGAAFTLMSAEELSDLRALEGFLNKTFEYKDVGGFNYTNRYVPSSEVKPTPRTGRTVFNSGARKSMRRRGRRR
jgi:ATP-dependent RNA helicase RhlE